MRVALIGCGATKASRTCPAQEMYRSQLFRACLGWSIRNTDRWLILSAKHGLLEPATVIEPYEARLGGKADREAWGRRVGLQLEAAFPWPAQANVEIVCLAGSDYSDAIELPDDRELYWEEPLRGLRVGERLAWLKARRAA